MDLRDLLLARGAEQRLLPPELWRPAGAPDALAALLDALAAAAGAAGGDPEAAAANVVVPPDAAAPNGPPPGEHVALTASSADGPGWPAPVAWRPGEGCPPALADAEAAAVATGATFAYVQRRDGRGSLTVFLPRATG